jgi:ribokinase
MAGAVTCVGSNMTDMITYCERAPGPGETIIGSRMVLGFGGKGANQAVMSRFLGSSVAIVTCVGDDANGAAYKRRLEEVGVDVAHVHTAAPGIASGCAPIWVDASGQNRIIVVPGANEHLTAEQAVAAVNATVKPGSVVVGQFEIPQPVTAAAFAAAKRLGAITVLNPAPAAPVLPELLASSDWLVPNESEFAVLSTGAASDATPSDAAILAFAAPLAPRLLVTLGAAGIAVVDSGRAAVTRLAAPQMSEAVRDTTGAGDAFVGAFCHALAAGADELAAITLGMACASDSVTREGTQASFPSKERCEALGLL